MISIHSNKVLFLDSRKKHQERQEGFGDIIEFAISRAEAAIKAYREMSAKSQSPGLRELLLELRDEERNHKLKIETEFARQVLKAE